MEIKNIEPDYLSEFKNLLKYCFGLEEDELELFSEYLYKPENCFGIFTDNQLAASLSIIPYQMYFNGNTVGMGGISAVSTFPEYRNNHYAEKLIINSLQVMRGRGDYFSLLDPFSYSFYRKYGWESVLEYKKYNFKIDHLKKFKRFQNYKFKKIGEKDLTSIIRVYEAYIKKYNGPLKRNKKDWKFRFKKHRQENIYRYGCLDDKENLKGYIFFKLKDNKINIEELSYINHEVKKEIFSFIYSHNPQLQNINWLSPADDNTILMLDDPGREYEISLGMMGRIIDVKKVLETYTIPDKVDTSFTLKVKDPYAEWNNKIFEIILKNKKVKVNVIDKKTENVDVFCSIQALSQLVSGYINLKERINLGGIKGDKNKFGLLDYLVPERNTYLNDFF
ncbi:MAG: GNAT family N-acetyltransferase [Halanaerobiales bacterium]